MKPLLIKTFHFLGGVTAAILLIALTALLVIGGTFMESHTGSHQYAEKNIYGTLLFSVLLWGFFINILIAALRRWPFRKKHVPFLITHLGLLMILAGVLFKHYVGVQGTMFLLEGSSTNRLMLSDSLALRIDNAGSDEPRYLNIPLQKPVMLQDLEIQQRGLFPHCCERYETFIKDNWVVLNGLPPFPLELPIKAPLGGREWTLLGKNKTDISIDVRQHYIDSTRLTFYDRAAGKIILEIPLKAAMQKPFLLQGHQTLTCLNIKYAPIEGLEQANLCFNIAGTELIIPLQGKTALQHVISEPFSAAGMYDIEVSTLPTILILQDNQEDLALAAFGQFGDVDVKTFRQDNLTSLYSYDNGFGGYSMQAKLQTLKKSRKQAEEQRIFSLKKQLTVSAIKAEQLSPPPYNCFGKHAKKKASAFQMPASTLWFYGQTRAVGSFHPHNTYLRVCRKLS